VTQDVGVGSFACVFGDVEAEAEDSPGFDALWQAASPGTDFAAMGCGTFRRISGPVGPYVIEAVQRTLQDAAVPAAEVDHVVFATSDPTLALLSPDLAVDVLEAVGAVGAVPHLLSMQRCCSSLTALQHAGNLFADPDVTDVVVVGLDFTPDDRDRVQSYALFGDAVAGCLLSRRSPGLVRLLASAVRVDPDGLRGQDSFGSRKKVADRALAAVLGGRPLSGVTAVFAANLYKPLASFNAAASGVKAAQMHFVDALAAYGHCGNADWMINLVDHHERTGIRPGETYLAQSLAQGFFACALLQGT
jgi:3-oxoacyl-[acyl-carrier-protein] synthase-3